jgi:hypothetical protein
VSLQSVSIPVSFACLRTARFIFFFNFIIWGLQAHVLEQNNINFTNLGPIYADVCLLDLQV